jgi:gliding motility-associated-like protein
MSQKNTRFQDFRYQSFIDFVPVPQSVCVSERIHFNAFDLNCSALPDFIESMHWDFGDGQSGNEINPDHTYFEEGEYPVELIVYKTDNCHDTILRTVTVKPNPLVDLGSDTIVPACSSILFNAGNSGAKYSWSTNQVSQTIELMELFGDTTVWVVVDKNGCRAGDTVHVSVKKNTVELQLYFPNAFSPNGDGKNDVFAAIGPTDDILLYQMNIFNRWGQQVFETNDPNAGWDGGNPIQAGVYVYKTAYHIEGHCIETKDYSKSGTVVLIK